MKELADAQVAIVGLGLMGGSLAGALCGHCRAVVGVAQRPGTIETALARGLIDRGTTDLAHGIREADVVVLATPVRVIMQQLAEIGPLLPEGCLLMDLGSTKAKIVEAMEALPPHLQAVGGHPMCGKEASGLEAAEADLYQGATFVLTPLRRTSSEALTLAQELVEAVGARPLLMDAERHDRLVAAVSHLPYLLSVGLVAATEEMAAEDELVWELAASGFRDTSRLAASDVTMMLDILLTNRAAVGETLSRFTNQLNALAHLLAEDDEEGLRSLMEQAQKRREGKFKVQSSKARVQMRMTVEKARGLGGRIKVPGDKSISHRALLLSAIAEGATRIQNFLPAADCLATLACVRALGVEVERLSETELIVRGRGLFGLIEPEGILDCAGSGTTIRLLAGILAGQPFYSVLTGNEQLRRRPMGRIVEPLRQMGATVLGRDDGRLPPLTILGGDLHGIEYRLPVVSAQVKSAILLAGLYADGPTVIHEPGPARDHTERMLAAMAEGQSSNFKAQSSKLKLTSGGGLRRFSARNRLLSCERLGG
ncbi:MAG: prephenate dehydrogenase/arogenate dehydrogenase family protein [Anaerolineae bacterium]|nr:prephenate dehydrogenase/arogenate dehydrogenase family protein [Anaerolineae bacterium]